MERRGDQRGREGQRDRDRETKIQIDREIEGQKTERHSNGETNIQRGKETERCRDSELKNLRI